MKIKTKTFILLLLFTVVIFPKTIKIACSNRDWYPFIYYQNKEIKGIHVDMIKEAARRSGHNVEFIPYPIRRAVLMAEIGRVDGIASIPYDKNYKGIEFPPESNFIKGNSLIQEVSQWRIMQIDKVVVTYNNEYRFAGGLENIPQPVRLVFHDQKLIDILNENKIKTEPVLSDDQNFQKLIRDKNGSLITTTITAEKMFEFSKYSEKIKIHSQPITSLSYYLGFSEKSKLSFQEKMIIWEEIVKLREDYVYILQLFAKY